MKKIYHDDTLAILKSSDGYYIQTYTVGMSPEHFFAFVKKQFPNIEFTNFQAVKKALQNAPYGPELFGTEKARVTVQVSDDQLAAYITLHVPDEMLDMKHRKDLVLEIIEALKKFGVSYGIIPDILKGELKVNKPILIARGIPPVHGRDSEIRMYEIREPKPTIIDNGKANYYDMNLINKVQAGDWLGERTDPTPGIPGTSVYGTEIEPVNGECAPIYYDRNSIEMVREEGKDVLYALKSGAVYYLGENISVYDVLEINGDVDFNSGNIDFNGYVSIKGTVEENFSVRAGKDIEISGEYGIGGVGRIESLDGNIYIRGGVAGKNRAKIICKNNLYVKYISDAEVICGGNVHVGFYVRNSVIRAKQVIVDSPRGQLAGGLTDVDVKVECAEIGNRLDTRTQIIVRGFDRNKMQGRMNEIISLVRSKKEQLGILKEMSRKPEKGKFSDIDYSALQKARFALRQIQDEIKDLERERLTLMEYMKTPDEGAVIVKKRIFPKVKLMIHGVTADIAGESSASVYIEKDGSIQSV